MGGTSSSQQTQSSTTAPWMPAQPTLQGILGQIGTGLGNTSLNGAETGALNTMENNGNIATKSYAPQISDNAANLLAGGGALSQAPSVQANYDQFVRNTSPIANNTNYNPYNTPGFGDAIGTLTSDITNQVNGQFAGAGRDFSGANSQALGRGIAQGVAPVIQSQYNSNVANQEGAANSLYGAGNTNAGLLSGLQQQDLANKQVGTQAATQALDAQNTGAQAALQAEAARRGIPVQALGLLAQIGIPIAGLGGQSTGQSQGTQQASGAQQFGQITGGLGGLFKGLFG